MQRRTCLLALAYAPPMMEAIAGEGGQVAAQFSVPDSLGAQRSLSDFKGKSVVLEWTSPSCPFVRAQYASGKMQELQRWATSRGVVWLSVLSTHPARADFLNAKQDTTFNQARQAAPTALLMDSDGRMGTSYGARNTPQMYVIGANGQFAYMGAIDDQPTVDAAVVVKSRNWVRAALEDLLAGRAVKVARTMPYGCLVGYAG